MLLIDVMPLDVPIVQTRVVGVTQIILDHDILKYDLTALRSQM
ncbi:MAG TPA: hypothetical protein VEL31_17160 [Ktedonobacteraceae bacterium]|nr:hypothetical protein [Ktedonobacteraceae bacterium]